jgi:hypothetical protein
MSTIMVKNDTNDPAIDAAGFEKTGNNIVKAEGFINSIAIAVFGLIFAWNYTNLAVFNNDFFNFIN